MYVYTGVPAEGEVAVTPVITNGRGISDRVASAYYHLVVDLVRQSDTRSEFLPICVVEAAVSRPSENHGTR